MKADNIEERGEDERKVERDFEKWRKWPGGVPRGGEVEEIEREPFSDGIFRLKLDKKMNQVQNGLLPSNLSDCYPFFIIYHYLYYLMV